MKQNIMHSVQKFIKETLITNQHQSYMLNIDHTDEFNNMATHQYLNNQSIQILLNKKSTQFNKFTIPHKTLFQNKQNQLITVPIKQYSNKFLREKRKQDLELNNTNKKKQPFPNSHLHHNRKLISEFKKHNRKSQKFKKSNNKQNSDCIIYNLLFQKDEYLNSCKNQRKTIFGAFTQDYCGQTNQSTANQQSTLFDKGWKTTKNASVFQAKKQIYQKICQKQKKFIPQYRKKCKTFGDVSNYQNNDQQKKFEKISTSRALEKYQKIIKINPQHGKIQKMKIKKQLAKSLRFQGSQKKDIQTKQIKLSRKQISMKTRSVFMSRDQDEQNTKLHHSIEHGYDKQNGEQSYTIKTPQKKKDKNKQNFITSKIGLFTSGIKFKKFRKFSHQVESNKKCVTQQKRGLNGDDTFDDFEINGWDINV